VNDDLMEYKAAHNATLLLMLTAHSRARMFDHDPTSGRRSLSTLYSITRLNSVIENVDIVKSMSVFPVSTRLGPREAFALAGNPISRNMREYFRHVTYVSAESDERDLRQFLRLTEFTPDDIRRDGRACGARA